MADSKRLNAWLDTIEIDDGSTWPLPRDATMTRLKVDANNGNRDAVESLRVIGLAYEELLKTTETRRKKIVRALQQARGIDKRGGSHGK